MDEFTCDDGQCIDINSRCNQLLDCRDESDEKDCNLLDLKSGYNIEVPPFETVKFPVKEYLNPKYIQDENNELIPARVNVSTVFKTVIDINEQDHKIELKFQIILEWYESRASYNNLKANPALNVLNNMETREIWIPYVIFEVSI